MNPKLNAIAEKAAADLKNLIAESEESILETWNTSESEAQANEQSPKFKMGLAITLDLDKDTMTTALSYGMKRKRSVSCEIPDPSKPELPLDDDAPQVDGVPLTKDQVKKAVHEINKKATGK